MFSSLSKKLDSIFDRLRGKVVLREEDVILALREIRITLLEADVALSVVKDFIETVKNKAIGEASIKSVKSSHVVVKIVHDELKELLSSEDSGVKLNAPSPFSYMIVGLQGSGKTTTTSKLGLYLRDKLSRKPLLVSLDIYRPAAQEQLEMLSKKLGLSYVQKIENEKPAEIINRSKKIAKETDIDVILYDTAGRLHTDEKMMQELLDIKSSTNPLEILFVGDSLMGQDAVKVADAFNKALFITGIILTKIDGDSKGGAALSIKKITNAPIKFLGVGEKPSDLEVFDAERMASRILNMGDVLGLVERAQEAFKEEDLEKLADIHKGKFDLNDMKFQLEKILKMGGITSLMKFIPGMGKILNSIKDSAQDDKLNDKIIKRQIAIIQSMTKHEKRNYKILNASRRRRIAKGCGQTVQDVNKLIKQFEQMGKTMKQMGKMRGFSF